MRLNLLLFLSVLLTALAASLFGAIRAVDVIEERSRGGVETALQERGLPWVQVTVDGLRVALSGTAPDEAARFAAVRATGTVVDAARVVDRMEIAAVQVITPPRFSVEILRNGDGISVIGLFPQAEDRARFLRGIERIADGAVVTDLMETSGFATPEGWSKAMAFGVSALSHLPRSKISVAPDRVAITAMAKDEATRRTLENVFSHEVPDGIALEMDISAPRPVITPFTLRLVSDAAGTRFDACTAGTESGLTEIVAAARDLGLEDPDCTVGLGSPSPDWAKAVVAGLRAVGRLGAGTLTFSDTDLSLVGTEEMDQALFDHEVGTLEAALPAAFSLTAVLPRPEGKGANEGPPTFTATRSPEGQIQLRGRIVDDSAKAALASFASARFGVDHVLDGTRLGTALPAGWSPRLIAALDALTMLHNGSVEVDPDRVVIRGTSGYEDARAAIARRLSDKLGEAAAFDISVDYERRLDPTLNLPTAATCVERINLALNARQITFAPGSDEIEGEAFQTLDTVAEILKECRDVEMTLEIGGHTDSQGRESMNQELSQARAEAVLEALRGRRVPAARITAHGYGEEFPIADNDTAEGREANRRIEVKLLDDGDEAAEGDADPPPEATAESGGPTDTGSGDVLTGGAEGEANEQN